MPKKKYNKNVNKNKNKNKNKIVININSNNKKRTVNKSSSNKSSSQPPQQQPLIINAPQQPQQPFIINMPQPHLPAVERNNPYMTANLMDNEFGIGNTRSLNALHGSVNDMQIRQDEARQNYINLMRRHDELDNLVRNREHELNSIKRSSLLDSEYNSGSMVSSFGVSSLKNDTLSNLGSSNYYNTLSNLGSNHDEDYFEIDFDGYIPPAEKHIKHISTNTDEKHNKTMPTNADIKNINDMSTNTDIKKLKMKLIKHRLEPFHIPSEIEMVDPIADFDGNFNYNDLPQAKAILITNPMNQGLTVKEFEDIKRNEKRNEKRNDILSDEHTIYTVNPDMDAVDTSLEKHSQRVNYSENVDTANTSPVKLLVAKIEGNKKPKEVKAEIKENIEKPKETMAKFEGNSKKPREIEPDNLTLADFDNDPRLFRNYKERIRQRISQAEFNEIKARYNMLEGPKIPMLKNTIQYKQIMKKWIDEYDTKPSST